MKPAWPHILRRRRSSRWALLSGDPFGLACVAGVAVPRSGQAQVASQRFVVILAAEQASILQKRHDALKEGLEVDRVGDPEQEAVGRSLAELSKLLAAK